MVFKILDSILFSTTPSLPFLMGGNDRQGEIKMVSASTPSANENAKDAVLVHIVQLKPMIKAQISVRMVSSGTSDVVFCSVHSEKIRLKELLIMIIIMKKSQDTTVFIGGQKLTSGMLLRPEK